MKYLRLLMAMAALCAMPFLASAATAPESKDAEPQTAEPVSYTHLTLPTKA